jgi:hypothetical protein
MDVASWLESHQDKFPELTLPKHYVPLKDICPEILWDASDDQGGLPEPLKPTRLYKRLRRSLLDPRVLWTQVDKSADKLFFIRHVPANSTVANWYSADVSPVTNEARAKDLVIYTICWWIPQGRVEQRSEHENKCAPEFHGFHPTSGFDSVLTNFRVSQLEQQLKRRDQARYALEVNLWDDGISGPLEWKSHSRSGHLLHPQVWYWSYVLWEQITV